MPLDDNALKVTVTADVAPILGAMNQAAQATESAASRMAKSLKETGMSSTDAASAMKNLGFSAEETAAAFGLTAEKAAQAAVQVSGLERAEAMAVARGTAMAANMGGLGFAMGRVAAATPGLASALAAAFPVFAVVALGDVIGNIVGKLEEARRSVVQAAAAWDDFAAATLDSADATATNNEKLEVEIAKLEGRPSPNALALGLAEARQEADRLTKSLEDTAAKISEILEKQNIGRVKAAFLGVESTSELKGAIEPMADALHAAYAEVDLARASHDDKALAQAKQAAENETNAILAEIAKRRAALDAEAHPPIAAVSADVPAEMRQTAPDPAMLQRTQGAQRKILDDLELVIKAMQKENEESEKGAKLEERKAAAAANRETRELQAKAAQDAIEIDRASGRIMEENAKRDLAQAKKQQKAAEDLGIAKLKAVEAVAGAQAKADEDAAKRALELHQITIAEYTERLKTAELNQLGAKKAELQAEVAVIRAQPTSGKAEEDDKAARLAEVNALLEALDIAHQERMAAIGADGAAKQGAQTMEQLNRQAGAAAEVANGQLETAMRIDEDRASHHLASLNQEATAEKAALDRWYAEQLAALQKAGTFAAQTYGKESSQYAELTRKKEELDQQYAEKSQRIAQQVADRWEQIFQKITGTINRDITQWITGHERFSKMAKQLGEQVETAALNTILKIGEKWAEHFIMVEVLDKTALAQQIANATAGAAAKHAVEATAAEASIGSSAAADGAAAFASVIEALPFPANIAAAPGVAAAVVGETEAFGALAAFDIGGVVPHTQLAMVHAGERVLTERQNIALERVANSSTNSTMNRNHFEIHIHAAENQLSRGDIVKAVKRAISLGELG